MLANLKKEMDRRGMSLHAFAAAAGITEAAARACICGNGDMPLRLMRRTKELFPNCTFAYLFESVFEREEPAEIVQK
ncbi:MAG: hypothetical protein WCP73_03670 [Eubacteriales bacterium]